MHQAKINLKYAALICLLAFSLAAPVAAQYPVVNTAHPRLYADTARLNHLKSGILIPGDMQSTFNEIRYAYTGWWINDPELYTEGTDSTVWTWNWGSVYARDQAFLCTFIFKLTADAPELKRCRFIARRLIDTIDHAGWGTMDFWEKESLIRKLSDAGGLLLDWCYNDLPVSLRNDLEQALFTMNTEFMTTYIYSSAGNSYVSSHNTWNTIFANQNALVLYNATGLTASQNNAVQQWYQDVYDKLQDGFIPCWTYYRDDDGGWNWGAAYAMWSLVDQFQLFENMRTGTGKDFYTDLPWVQNSINQYLYFMQPNNQTLHLGDGEMTLTGDRVMYLHARMYDDPRSKWLVQRFSAATGSTMEKFSKLLYKDFSMPAVPHHNAPLQWWADKVGLSVSRSSWDSSATMVAFFNSPSKRAAHEHRDNNSFTVFKHRPLLIDAGYYDAYNSAHYLNYYQRTIAHNSICVFDSAEVYTAYGNEVANDGGQIESAALMNIDDITAPENQRGEWVQYAANDAYTYNIADARLSYDSSKLDFFRRRLLYLPPDKIIVLDHIHLKHTASLQRDVQWTAHFVNRPGITGSITGTSVPEHILTYDGKDYTAANGSGTIALRTLLPAETSTTLIGGNGYEYWVNGTNYPPLTAPDSTFNTSGSWRIEVRPAAVTDTVVYLHTIQTGDSVHIALPGGMALSNDQSIGVDWLDSLYFFAADAAPGKTYHYLSEVAGSRTLTLFAADLQPGSYDIKVNGVLFGAAPADANGILIYPVSLPGGNHLVEITHALSGIKGTAATGLFSVYPNPAGDRVTLSFNDRIKSGSVAIYDLSGKCLQKYPVDNTETFYLRLPYPSGTYLVVVNADSKRPASVKVIKR